jgi:6-phosphogluconolactonase (cycloisomerase 2 family)
MEGSIGLGKQWRFIKKATRIRRIGWVAILALSLLGTAPRLSSNDDRAGGYLYTINNDIQQNGVAVLAQNSDGSLSEIPGSPFSTGGKGLGGGDIDQQGAIRVHGNYVLAVNPGSNSVAVLRKGEGGKLMPVAGSPFPSGGSAPLSLTISGDLVYVANQAPSFANPTSAPTIMGFRIGSDGRLTPIANSKITFDRGHGPAQVEFSTGGETVAVTSGFQDEATSEVHGYKVQADGTLKEGPGSPVHATGASGDVGFSWNPEGDRIYVSNFRGDAVTVFDVDKQTGGVKQIGAAHPTQGSAACWTAISADGNTLYVANFVSNSISTFAVHADGKLKLLGISKRRGATHPDTKDMVISKDGKFLYVVASGAREIAVFSIGADRVPTELPAGKSPMKLGAGQNILGLTVG